MADGIVSDSFAALRGPAFTPPALIPLFHAASPALGEQQTRASHVLVTAANTAPVSPCT